MAVTRRTGKSFSVYFYVSLLSRQCRPGIKFPGTEYGHELPPCVSGEMSACTPGPFIELAAFSMNFRG